MEYYISQLINGLSQGAIYALMAIGYSVIVGITGMVTFVHGEVIMIGAYTAFYLYEAFGSNILLMICGSLVSTWLLGIIIYKVCYERFLDAPRQIALICTIGFSMLLKNLVSVICGPNQQTLLNVVENKFYGTDKVNISQLQLLIIITVVFLSSILMVMFNKTKWGISLRAIRQDKQAAYLVGINVNQRAMVGNCIGCSLGGVGGMLIALYYQTAYPAMGSAYSIKAFSSSILGGLTDVRFSAIGGVFIGVIENLGVTFFSATLRDVFAFVFLITMLLIRPKGFTFKKEGR